MLRLRTGFAILAAAGSMLVSAASAAADVKVNIGLGIPSVAPPVVIAAPPQLGQVPV